MPLKKKSSSTTQEKNKESSPKGLGSPKRLPMRRFFDAVREDLEVISEALDYYDKVIQDGAQYIDYKGKLEKLVVETPGLAYFYGGVRTDAQQIRRWLEKFTEAEKAKKFKWFHSDPEAKKKFGDLKVTEISKYVDADEDIEALVDLTRVMAEAEHRLDDLIEAFEWRRLSLSRVIDIRKDNLHEVWVDPGACDTND